MNIEKAKLIKVGDIVSFPPDRGDKGGQSKVVHVSTVVNKNIHGAEYLWISLTPGCGVWPSNRLL